MTLKMAMLVEIGEAVKSDLSGAASMRDWQVKNFPPEFVSIFMMISYKVRKVPCGDSSNFVES